MNDILGCFLLLWFLVAVIGCLVRLAEWEDGRMSLRRAVVRPWLWPLLLAVAVVAEVNDVIRGR